MPIPTVTNLFRAGHKHVVRALADRFGNFVEVIEDGSGDWRLAVDAIINGSSGPIDIEDLNYIKDSVESVLRDAAGNRVTVVDDVGTFRLSVDIQPGATVQLDGQPGGRWLSMDVPVMDGAAKDMNVNGSPGAPIDFISAPGPGVVWFVEELALFIGGSGSGGLYDFGTGMALVNGLQMLVDVAGEKEITNLLDNMDIAIHYGDHLLDPASGGIFGSLKTLTGRMRLPIPVELRGDDGDQIIYRVRDNLTGTAGLRGSVRVRLEV